MFFFCVWSNGQSAGKPQIILATWFDTYEYAARIEYLGIGIYGNKTAAPGASTEEFGNALSAILLDKSDKSQRMHERAKTLGDLCQKSGGRKYACDVLFKEAQ